MPAMTPRPSHPCEKRGCPLYHLFGSQGRHQNVLKVGLEVLPLVVDPSTAKHGSIPSVLMLASKVTFFPQLRGKLPNARSPPVSRPGIQGCQRGVSAPIKSAKPSSSVDIDRLL